MSQAAAFSHVSQFAPTDLSGCVLWLRADLGITLDGSGKVAQWRDLSGAGNHATQYSPATAPAYGVNTLGGRRVVTFGGAHTLQHGAALRECTIAHVSRTTGGVQSYQCVIKTGTEGGGVYVCARGMFNEWGVYMGGEKNSGVLSGSWQICVATIRAYDDVDLRTNGISVTRTTGTNWYTDGKWIGSDELSQCLTGDIAEISTWNRALTSPELADVERALGRRYGIAVA